MNISLFVTGLISILGQVVLLRELNVAFFGVELIYLLALGIWLFWTAVGAVIGRRTFLPSRNHLTVLFLLFGLVMPLDIIFIRSSRLLLGGMPGTYPTVFQQLIIAVISILPAALLSGLLFQWTAKSYVITGRTLAMAYTIESAGGLFGGLFSTLFIMWGLQNLSTGLVCALVSCIIPVIILKRFRKSYLFRTSVIMTCIFSVLLWKAGAIDHFTTTWNHPHLLESSDSPYGRIAVDQLYHQISVFENDALAFETEGTDAEYFCHLTALQHPRPQNVLILGGGVEGTVRELAKYNPRQIDYVELNPVLLRMVARHLPDDINKSLKAPGVNIILTDPRQYLKNSGKYDLILVGMPEPSSGQANRFYTQEFFRQCSAKLNPGGILGFRLRTAENLWTRPLIRRNASIYNALQSVFPHVLFLPGSINVVTASQTELPGSPEIMSRRLKEMNIATRLVSPAYIGYLFTNDRFSNIRDLLQKEKPVINTDIRPVCYQYAFLIWLSKFFPRLALIDLSSIIDNILSKTPSSLLFWIGLPVIFLASRPFPKLRRVMLVAAAGLMGMILEIIFILYYQTKHGVLYQDIGVLLTSFMAGLALGALIIDKQMLRPVGNQRISRWYGAGLLAGFCLLCTVTKTIMAEHYSAGLFQISALLVVTGFLVAGIFAHTSLYGIEDQQKVISPLYAADLIGGCIGSLLGSLILIPLAGMDTSALVMLLFAVFSFILA